MLRFAVFAIVSGWITALGRAQTCEVFEPIGRTPPSCYNGDGSAAGEVNVVCNDARYCEIFELMSTSPTKLIIWNTLGCSNCPDEEWNEFWSKHGEWSGTMWALLVCSIIGIVGLVTWRVLGKELGPFGWILMILLLVIAIVPPLTASVEAKGLVENGPRWWTLDSIVQRAPEPDALLSDRGTKKGSFNGIGAKFVAILSGGSEADAFEDTTVERTTVFRWGKGRQVYALKSPDNKTYIMQSYHLKDTTLNGLFGLKDKLKLPSGYDYQCKVVGDNGLELVAPGGIATVTQDNFHNTYMMLVDSKNCFPFSSSPCIEETEQTMDEYKSKHCSSNLTV